MLRRNRGSGWSPHCSGGFLLCRHFGRTQSRYRSTLPTGLAPSGYLRSTRHNQAPSTVDGACRKSAERLGFEPRVPKGHNGFRDRPVQPLRHLSKGARCVFSVTYIGFANPVLFEIFTFRLPEHNLLVVNLLVLFRPRVVVTTGTDAEELLCAPL